MKKNKRILLLIISFLSVLILILDITEIMSFNKYIKISIYIYLGLLPFISLKKNN